VHALSVVAPGLRPSLAEVVADQERNSWELDWYKRRVSHA